MSEADIDRLMASTKAILLDFDGPVCSIFAGHPAPVVADQLRALLAYEGAPMWAISETQDPLEVLRETGRCGQRDWTVRAEEALRAAELVASDTASPTPDAREAIVAANRTGRQVAIVSNNSEVAIHRYITRQGLERYIQCVIGRKYAAPETMKPCREPVVAAATALDIAPSQCVLIGDSVSDMIAAASANVCPIGYANAPGKAEVLEGAGATIVIASMRVLAGWLR